MGHETTPVQSSVQRERERERGRSGREGGHAWRYVHSPDQHSTVLALWREMRGSMHAAFGRCAHNTAWPGLAWLRRQVDSILPSRRPTSCE